MAHLSIEPNELVTFKVAYEDDQLLVVVKPARVVTLPGKGHDRNTLLNGLFARYGNVLQNMGREREFGLLHRLDRETSGLVMVALRPSAYDHLVAMFKARRVAKFYWALVQEAPKRASGVIQKPIAERTIRKGGKHGPLMKLARISSMGKPAATAYRVVQSSRLATLLECRAITGKLHQLRVHLASIGCPILGDDLYGPETVRDASPRLALHAHRVVFPHPVKGLVDVRAPWPADLKGVLQRLEIAKPDNSRAVAADSEAGVLEKIEGGALAGDSGVDGADEIEDGGIGDEEAGLGEDDA